jgi:hypothetical protein
LTDAAAMTMPKAPVDEFGGLPSRGNDVRRLWKVAIMESESIAQAMQK